MNVTNETTICLICVKECHHGDSVFIMRSTRIGWDAVKKHAEGSSLHRRLRLVGSAEL
jgi:hypothetical protein